MCQVRLWKSSFKVPVSDKLSPSAELFQRLKVLRRPLRRFWYDRSCWFRHEEFGGHFRYVSIRHFCAATLLTWRGKGNRWPSPARQLRSNPCKSFALTLYNFLPTASPWHHCTNHKVSLNPIPQFSVVLPSFYVKHVMYVAGFFWEDF